MAKLVVYPDAVDRTLNQMGGLVFSQRILLALTQAGVSREDSYRIVQRNAMEVWNGKGQLLDLLKGDSDVTDRLSMEQLEEVFDLGYHTKHVDTIFQRVFGES
jgi:adenylosuccinate lyase